MVTSRLWLSVGLIVAVSVPGVAADKDQPVKVGNELLFMVADFAPGGPFHGHCGCPSAMIGNHDAKAIVIWSKTADEATLQLARDANRLLGDDHKKQAYLILFDLDDDAFDKAAKKAAVDHVTVGIARAGSAPLFKKAELDAQNAQVIMLVDDKKIAAVWQFKAEELTKEKSQAIVKETTAFLR
jgi:hypothetical protein